MLGEEVKRLLNDQTKVYLESYSEFREFLDDYHLTRKVFYETFDGFLEKPAPNKKDTYKKWEILFTELRLAVEKELK